MSKAIADLMNDHDAILTALGVFSKILDTFKKTNANPDELLDFLDFLMEFADKCHHGKEEGILFPAMIAAGVPDRGGPIGVMMAEHIQGRGYIHTMLESLEKAPEDFDGFEKAGRAYIQLLQTHIQKENTVLFPMADRVILPDILDSIYQGFEQHEEKVIGHGRHEELHAMLNKLSAKYLK